MLESKMIQNPHIKDTPLSPRGEDENANQLLSNMIEGLASILCPKNYVMCVLGRHPKPPDESSKFCASLYSMSGKTAARNLDIGPEMGGSRQEALTKLLYKVEVEVGRMQLKDARKC